MKRDIKILALIFSLLFAVVGESYAAKISGRVCDSSTSEPLIGASVSIKGGVVGTATDIDGNFILDADEDATLEISYLGYNKMEVAVGAKVEFEILLDAATESLDEVVVVGYGQLRKSDITGSVSSIDVDDLGQTPVTTVDQLLVGQSAGVQVVQNSGAPGAGFSVNIRGNSSISGDNMPLYIVDGLALDNASTDNTISPLSSLNSNDIKSIEILKDASATAIYGSRGANGVVLITTKSGESGRAKINYTYRVDVANLTKQIDVLNINDYNLYVNEYRAYAGIYSNSTNKNQVIQNSASDYEYGDSWQDMIYQTAVSQEHLISISGGSDKGTYSVSGGYLMNKGIILNSDFRRYSISSNLTRNVTKWLKIGANMSYSKSSSDMAKQSNSDGDVSSSVVLGALIFRPTVDPYQTLDEYDVDDLQKSPLAIAEYYRDNVANTMIRAKAYADIQPLKDLTFRTTFGISDSRVLRKTYAPSFLCDDTGGEASRTDNLMFTYSIEELATYNYTKGRSRLSAVAGFSYQKWNQDNMTTGGSGFINDDIGYENLGMANCPTATVDNRIDWALMSYFARLNYSFNDKYVLTVTGRYDGTTRLADKWSFFPSAALAWRIKEEKFLKDVDWLSNLKLRVGYGVTGSQAVSVLQSVATLSNTTVPSGETGSLSTAIITNSMGNSSLKWELNRQANLGLDMGFLNNKIRVTVDGYIKTTEDLLVMVDVPTSTGYSSYFDNCGEVRNRGIDLDIFADVMKRGDFAWSTSVNFSKYKNEIVDLGDYQAIYGKDWFNTGSYSLQQPINVAMVGQSIGSFYGYVTDGIFNSQDEINAYATTNAHGDSQMIMPDAEMGQLKIVDLNGDGEITPDDRTILGDVTPDFYGSWTNNFSWRDLSLSFTLTASVGAERANMNRWVLEHQGNSGNNLNISKEAWDNRVIFEVMNEATGNIYQYSNVVVDKTAQMRFTDTLVEDASYLRLQSLQIGYSLPADLIKRIKVVQGIRFFFTATNLFTITPYSGYDPEANINTSGLNQGGDLGVFPTTRTFSFGASIDF